MLETRLLISLDWQVQTLLMWPEKAPTPGIEHCYCKWSLGAFMGMNASHLSQSHSAESKRSGVMVELFCSGCAVEGTARMKIVE
jgi:hypothetical protein